MPYNIIHVDRILNGYYITNEFNINFISDF